MLFNQRGVYMKKLAVVLAVAGLLSACGTTGNYNAQFKELNERQERQTKIAISEAPDWMSRLPKSPNAVYENGTATSTDFGMADMKAKTIAYAKICTSAGGKVRSQTKVFRSDNGDASVENSEMAIRSMCADIDITGVETVEMKHVAEGNRIRTYVLVALPIGSANVLRSTKAGEARAPEAFKELDEITTGKPSQSGTPAQKGDKVGVVNPDGTSSTLTLMPVENAEYKERRAEALEKPGAVVGQVTVR
jgi:hypothetical protein